MLVPQRAYEQCGIGIFVDNILDLLLRHVEHLLSSIAQLEKNRFIIHNLVNIVNCTIQLIGCSVYTLSISTTEMVSLLETLCGTS